MRHLILNSMLPKLKSVNKIESLKRLRYQRCKKMEEMDQEDICIAYRRNSFNFIFLG